MSAERNRRALETAITAWNAGSLDGYLELYSPSIIHHGPAPEPMDAVQNRGFYDVFWSAFPGSRLIIQDTVAEGDRLSARFVAEVEHRGEFMGIPATGRTAALGGQTIMQFVDGKVEERWTSPDMLGLLVQLGAVPPPGG